MHDPDNFIPLDADDLAYEENLESPEYGEEIGTSEVKHHFTMDILDASKIKAFMDCQRGFFFRHVLGWGQEEPRIHLVFGSAWHDSMEHMLHHGYDAHSIHGAYEKFMAVWNEAYGSPLYLPDSSSAKNPSNALLALTEYGEKWRREDEQTEVLITETAGAIPVAEDRMVFIKLDSLLAKYDGVWSREHKTTGRESQSWMDAWSYDIQIGLYGHGIHFVAPHFGYDSSDVKGVEINGAIFRKGTKNKPESGNKFIRIPIIASGEQNLNWLFEINHWIDQINWNMQELSECSPNDPVMYSFPRNGVSCGKFGCRFRGLCTAWANPLRNCHEPPPGYMVDFWDPRRVVEEAQNELIVDPSTQKASVVHKGRKEGVIRKAHD